MINIINDFTYKPFFDYTNLDNLRITKSHITLNITEEEGYRIELERYKVMKKIDFHVHTKTTELDKKAFEFDLDILFKYINDLSIDAIAITNHNIFDKEQYDEISKSLNYEEIIIIRKKYGYRRLMLNIIKDSNYTCYKITSKHCWRVFSVLKYFIKNYLLKMY